MDKTIFLKCSSHSKVNQGKVILKDVAEVYCADTNLANKAKVVTITNLKKEGERKVLSVLYIMEQLEKALPGAVMESIGEIDVIVEWEKPPKMEILKIAVVSLIAFFGTAFTIMAFHNDIGIDGVFTMVYEQVMGEASNHYTVLEFFYSIGLAIGIIVFFNHVGGRRITKDPTPIEVEMKVYEESINKTLTEVWNREGKTIDVH